MNPISKPDYMPIPELRKMQLEKLQKLIPYEYEHVALFRRRCDEKGVKPRDLVTLADLAKFPFMKKTDLRDEYPYGLTAAPMSEINRFHCSSGTTGKPICIPQTAEDVAIWTEGVARCMAMYGITRDDIVQVSYGYGLFTGGLGMHYAAERLGAAVVPASAGNTEKQVMLMKDFGVTTLCCTPSYALQIAEVGAAMGVDMHSLKLRAGHFGAEPWTEAMRKHIEEVLPLKAYDIYGLSEVAGPGVAGECTQQSGLHFCEDHFYPEIIDPETGAPLPDGEKGELVVTCLSKYGQPLLRYRTRDITCILPDACPCGRTTRRIARLMGRTDDMLIIRGVNVFPSQIEDVLVRVKGVLPQYLITVDRQGNLDTMEIQIEIGNDAFTDKIKTLEALRADLQHRLKTVLNVGAKVKLCEPGSIERTLGKAVRVRDLRKI